METKSKNDLQQLIDATQSIEKILDEMLKKEEIFSQYQYNYLIKNLSIFSLSLSVIALDIYLEESNDKDKIEEVKKYLDTIIN